MRGFGFEREHLQLGRGSNPGVIRAEDQPRGEDDALRGFFDATRRGAVETLAFQAAARGDDLLWEPLRVAKEVARPSSTGYAPTTSSSTTSRSAPGWRW